ncbi:MAG: hypothetical protein P8P48_13830 [Saprospiraceae bacterium]|nr:hypothetical protein [Saprospiraceae bacterium]
MKRSIHKFGLASILFILLVTPSLAQQGYFGKKFGIQVNGIYHRYSNYYLASNSLKDGLIGENLEVLNNLRFASIRIISPEISLNYAYKHKKSLRAGIRTKRIPVLQTLTGGIFNLPYRINMNLVPTAESVKTTGVYLRSIFLEFKKSDRLSMAPIGSYKSFGLEYNILNIQKEVGNALLAGVKYPIILTEPTTKSFLSVSLNAGRNIPLTQNLLLNIDCRFSIPIILRTNTSGERNLDLNFNSFEEHFYLSLDNYSVNDILIERMRLITYLKLNFSMGIQYMLL